MHGPQLSKNGKNECLKEKKKPENAKKKRKVNKKVQKLLLKKIFLKNTKKSGKWISQF